ncbi:MAG: S8 family serine peptidase [Archangium sp.]|nr:S8 family serine peptidase [Archangium sp.]
MVRGASLASGRTAVTVTRNGQHFEAEVGDEAIALGRPQVPGVEVVRRASASLDAWVVRGRPGEDGVAVAQRLAAAGVEASANVWLARFPAGWPVPPNDARYEAQWYLKTLRIEGAWRLTQGSADIVVAVIDSGCDATHPDLKNKLLPGRDVIDRDDDPTPPAGRQGSNHGTACAGLVAAETNNAEGMAGACPECKLRCIRMLGNRGDLIPITADLEAFDFVVSTQADVVSNSWSYGPSTPVPPMVAQAITTVLSSGRGGRGAVVVFAAGNDDNVITSDRVAAVPGVITVGALNNFDEAAPFSNRGEALSVTSPTGTFTLDIVGADGDSTGDYTSLFGGTSSACPLVAGIAGLVLSAKPDASPAEVKSLLEATARRAPFAVPDARGHDALYGYGIVDPTHALQRVMGVEPDAGVDAGVVEVLPETLGPSAPGGCHCGAVGGEAVLGGALLLVFRRALRR